MSKADAVVVKKVEFHPTILAVLDELQEWLGLEDHCAVLQKAVQTLAIIKDHGGTFYVETPEGALLPVVFDEFAEASEETAANA